MTHFAGADLQIRAIFSQWISTYATTYAKATAVKKALMDKAGLLEYCALKYSFVIGSDPAVAGEA